MIAAEGITKAVRISGSGLDLTQHTRSVIITPIVIALADAGETYSLFLR